MEIKQEAKNPSGNNDNDKDKKTKRPTLAYYQPPGSRQTSSKVNKTSNESIKPEGSSKKEVNDNDKNSKKSYKNNRIAKEDQKLEENDKKPIIAKQELKTNQVPFQEINQSKVF
jgi:hypothetical protein